MEREKIRLRRLAGDKPPWTDDPILKTYRFCNVQRRHDKVSQWIIENLLPNRVYMETLPFLQLVALGRWINWPPTLLAIIRAGVVRLNAQHMRNSSIDFASALRRMTERRSAGEKVWTGAYMIRAPSARGGFEGYSKPQFVIELIEGMKKHEKNLMVALSFNSVRGMVNAFMELPNFGSFMAGQIVADLTYTEMLGRAHDLYTWAPMGPGSRRGFNRMLGLPLKHPAPTEEVWCTILQRWREELVGALTELDEGFEPFKFTLHDVQNCLCETDKWLRVQNGEGRPRATYQPEMAF